MREGRGVQRPVYEFLSLKDRCAQRIGAKRGQNPLVVNRSEMRVSERCPMTDQGQTPHRLAQILGFNPILQEFLKLHFFDWIPETSSTLDFYLYAAILLL